MALPSSGQISFDNVRVETSQSLAPNYNIGDWTAGAWLSESFAFNTFAPINLISSGSGTYKRYTSASLSRFDPYLNNSMSAWYEYNHFATMSEDSLFSGDYLYTHTGTKHCYPSSMIPVDVGTTNKIVYITISGSADALFENVVVYYGKPWESNGTGSGNWQFITASGHFYPPYTGDINMEFSYNYKYTASLGQNIYFVIYGDYCVSP
jgi:hypothetical protein